MSQRLTKDDLFAGLKFFAVTDNYFGSNKVGAVYLVKLSAHSYTGYQYG